MPFLLKINAFHGSDNRPQSELGSGLDLDQLAISGGRQPPCFIHGLVAVQFAFL